MYGGNQQGYPPNNQSYPPPANNYQSYPPSSQQSYPPAHQQSSYPPVSGGQQYPPQNQQQYRPQQGQQQYAGGQYPQGAQYGAPQGYPQQGQQYGQPPYGQQPYGQQYGQTSGQMQQPGYGGAAGQTVAIVDRSYCLPHEQVFFLEESLMSLSGDDFTIRDGSNAAHYYKLSSSAFSMSGSRVLKDAGGRTILNMKHKMLSGKLWFINRGTNDKDVIAEVKKPMNTAGRPVCEIFLKGNTSHHFSTPRPDFVGQGDVRGKAFMIYRGQQPIAEISRKLAQESGKQRMTGKDSYALKVFPGQDAAFCIALCLIIDELFHD